MKRAKEIKVGNRTYTQLQCLNCGAITKVPGHIACKKARQAIQRDCGACRQPYRTAWYKAFGLEKNCYVYGPMPAKRTSEHYRREEARRMGYMLYMWDDGLKEDRLKRAGADAQSLN